MARIARQRGRDVIGRLGHARSALGVAGGALARAHTGVIKGRRSEAHETGMAAVAGGRGGDMTRGFSQGVHTGERTVVAVRALSRQDTLHRRVGKRRGCECPVHRVACIARKCCRDVIGRLASRADAVTGDACARYDADMVEARAHPGRRAMA